MQRSGSIAYVGVRGRCSSSTLIAFNDEQVEQVGLIYLGDDILPSHSTRGSRPRAAFRVAENPLGVPGGTVKS